MLEIFNMYMIMVKITKYINHMILKDRLGTFSLSSILCFSSCGSQSYILMVFNVFDFQIPKAAMN